MHLNAKWKHLVNGNSQNVDSFAVHLIDILVNYRLITKQLKVAALNGVMKALFNYAIESEMIITRKGFMLALSIALALICSLGFDGRA